jgi:hypothetical protein
VDPLVAKPTSAFDPKAASFDRLATSAFNTNAG